MQARTVLGLAEDFKTAAETARILEAEVAALILSHKDHLPQVPARIGFGDEAEMLQLDEELFLRLKKGGFFHRIGGGNGIPYVTERICLFDGRFTANFGRILQFLADHSYAY